MPAFTFTSLGNLPEDSKVALYRPDGRLDREVMHDEGRFDPPLEVPDGWYVAVLVPGAVALSVFQGSELA